MPDVFISHRHEDGEFAARIGEGLRSRGLAVWLDQEVDPGAQWVVAVDKAMSDSKNVLFLLSGGTSKSSWVRAEAAIALSQGGKRLIPIYCSKDAEVPFMLKPFKGLDLSEPASFEAGMARLGDLIRGDVSESDRGETADAARVRLAMAERSALEIETARYEALALAKNRMMTSWLSKAAGLIAVTAAAVGIGSVAYQQALLPLVAIGGAVTGFVVSSMLSRMRRTAESTEDSE